jgi:glucosamine kinase
VFETLAVTSLSELPALAYGGSLTRERFASLTPIVVQVAHDGDPEARAILETAAEELALIARSVARRLDFSARPFPLIFSGGLFTGIPGFAEAVAGRAGIPDAQPRLLDREPAEGALAMALDLFRSRKAARA